jgi:hypothetical protein
MDTPRLARASACLAGIIPISIKQSLGDMGEILSDMSTAEAGLGSVRAPALNQAQRGYP